MLEDFIDKDANEYCDQAGFHNDVSDFRLSYSFKVYLICVQQYTNDVIQEWIRHHRHKRRLPQFYGRRHSLTTTL